MYTEDDNCTKEKIDGNCTKCAAGYTLSPTNTKCIKNLYLTENGTLDSGKKTVFSFTLTDQECNENCTYFISVSGTDNYLGAYAPKDISETTSYPIWIQNIQTKATPTNHKPSPTEYLSNLENYKWIVVSYSADYFVIKNVYTQFALSVVGNNITTENMGTGDTLEPKFRFKFICEDKTCGITSAV